MGFNTFAEEVEEIIADVLQVDIAELDDSSTFGKDLPAESLDFVEMAEQIEDSCEVSLSDDDLEEIDTVGDLKGVVNERA